MKERWQALLGRHDHLSLRERALVILSALAVIYLLWDFALYRPLAQERARVEVRLGEREQALELLAREEALLRQANGGDPAADLKRERAALEAQVARLDANLAELSVGLVPANQLASILQEVLAQADSLQLDSLQTLPVEELQLTVKTDADAANAGVYKHSVAIAVRGSYFQLVDYLKKLEAMHWRFYWDDLHFEQEQYPVGLFQLRVYTLSTEEGLLGV